MKFNRCQLFEYLRSHSSGMNDPKLPEILFNYVSINSQTENVSNVTNLQKQLSLFLAKVQCKWQKAGRHTSRFLSENERWLSEDQEFSELSTVAPSSAEASNEKVESSLLSVAAGRPSTSFEESSERSKRRKTEHLREFGTQELLYACQMKLREDGELAAASIVKSLSSDFHVGDIQRNKSLKLATSQSLITPYSPDEALALYLDSQLSRDSYLMLRLGAKEKGADIYPTLQKLHEAKRACYPNAITISDHKSSVELQCLLDHTVLRLCKALDPEISTVINNNHISKLTLRGKWGFDGATGQSLYKQTSESHRDFASEESLFIVSYVPLQLLGISEENHKDFILWINPRPSSTHFCRPISFEFIKETS